MTEESSGLQAKIDEYEAELDLVEQEIARKKSMRNGTAHRKETVEIPHSEDITSVESSEEDII